MWTKLQLLLAIFVSVYSISALAGGPNDIKFDAKNNSFDSQEHILDASKPVNLEITGINTFKYKYTITGTLVDNHNITLPASLSSLISIAKPATSTAPTFSKYSVMSHQVELAVSNKGKPSTSPPPSKCNHDQETKLAESMTKEKKALEDEINKLNSIPSEDKIIGIINDGIDNVAIVDSVKQTVCKGVDTCNRSALIENAQKYADNYNVTYSEWKKDFNSYAQLSNCALDASFTDFDNQIAKIDASGIVKDRTIVANLFAAILDESIVPRTIVRSFGKPDSDQFNLSVEIDRIQPSYLSIDQSTSSDPINTFTTLDATISSHVYQASYPIQDRWVLDYSAGLGVTNLKQTNYYLGSGSIINAGTSDSSNVGAAILAQYYPTRSFLLLGHTYLSFGPCLGILQADQTAYLAGVSAIIQISPKVRISYSTGLAWGKVTDLNGDQIGSKPNGSTINTASHMEQGNFNALTFAFSY